MAGLTPLTNCRCLALLTLSWIRKRTKLAGMKDMAKITQMDTTTSVELAALWLSGTQKTGCWLESWATCAKKIRTLQPLDALHEIHKDVLHHEDGNVINWSSSKCDQASTKQNDDLQRLILNHMWLLTVETKVHADASMGQTWRPHWRLDVSAAAV